MLHALDLDQVSIEKYVSRNEETNSWSLIILNEERFYQNEVNRNKREINVNRLISPSYARNSSQPCWESITHCSSQSNIDHLSERATNEYSSSPFGVVSMLRELSFQSDSWLNEKTSIHLIHVELNSVIIIEDFLLGEETCQRRKI